jgi:hypothetical protein
MPEKLRVAVPLLVTVAVWLALVVPTTCDAKLRLL